MRPNEYMMVLPKIDPSVFASNGMIVDQFGKPPTDGAEPCELALAPWPNTSTTLLAVARAYLHEHVIPRGGDARRSCIGLRSWIFALDPQRDVSTLTRADGRTVVQYDLARGVKPATARRNMAMGIAALNHARKEERIKAVPKFQMPDASASRLRWLTREEHRKLMLVPKPRRQQLFWLLAFATGARSHAIIELRWEQVDLEARTIDFRRPGVVYHNKRRAVVPISDSLLPRLQAAFERRTDEYVIGLGPKGKASCNYRLCKADLAAIGITEEGVARHVARHTVASWILQEGGSIYDAAKMLGDTVSMIERIYCHVEPKHLLKAANLL